MLCQFSSVTQLCPTLCDPMNHSTPGLPVHHQLRSSLKFMSIESVMPSNHLILCHPLLLLPPIPPSIRIFSNESTVRMRWPKYWSFSFSIIPSKEHPGSPVCCSPLSRKESDMTEQLNWLHWRVAGDFGFSLLHPLGLEQCLEQNGCC